MDVFDVQRRVHEAWTEQRWAEWRDTCATGYRFELTPGVGLDIDQTVVWSRAWFSAFPDYREVVRGLYSSENAVAYEIEGTGTSAADLVLFDRVLAPYTPGRGFVLRYAKVLDLDEAGRVTADRQYLDPQSLRDQLAA